MTITPYIFFNGQAREAIECYAEIFGVAVPEMMTMADGPDMGLPEERKTWVMHCEMDFGGGSKVMISDDFAGNSPAMEGSSLMASFPTAAEAKTAFDKLAEGGEVRVAWEPTFWSAGFGALTDRFGIRWMVDTEEQPEQG